VTRTPVVAFPFHDWRKTQREGTRTRDAHVLQWLARDPRLGPVLVVDRPVSRAERWIRRQDTQVDGRRIAAVSGRGWRAWVTEVREGLLVLDVAVPDLFAVVRDPRRWWFDVAASSRATEPVAWAVALVLATHPHGLASIAWTPTAAPLVRALQPARFVFDSLDNWLIHPVLRRHAHAAIRSYEALLPQADLVSVAAPASADALRPFAPSIEVIPNGVDVERFAAPVDRRRPTEIPAGPIIGYAGKLAERIDVDLCVATAASLPDVTFVFLGPVLDRSVRRLEGVPNVRLLGDWHPDRLPAALRAFDVAWIPHRVGEGETGGDPIKLYEYWAAGRQVVTTAIDGHTSWLDRAFVVDDAESAAAAIRGILDGRLHKPVWVEEERHWSVIARRFGDVLSGG
jgi:glycosyltransferase involved in cell wall biosynthesis